MSMNNENRADNPGPPPLELCAFLIINNSAPVFLLLPWSLLSYSGDSDWAIYVTLFVTVHLLISWYVLSRYHLARRYIRPAVILLTGILLWHKYFPNGYTISSFFPANQSAPNTKWGVFGYAIVTESVNGSDLEWSFDLAQLLLNFELANVLIVAVAFGLALKQSTWNGRGSQ